MRGSKTLRLPVTLGLLLAACGSQPAAEQPAANTAAAPRETGYIAKVLALPPRQLNGVLYRAIDDAKRPCQGIAEATRQKDRGGKPVWAVRCIDNSAWLIALGDDGMADVTGIPGNGAS